MAALLPVPPHLVKISGNKFLLLWTKDEKVHYCTVNGVGERTSDIYQMDGELSDCVPAVINGKAVWYTWDNKVNTFYTIDSDDLSHPSTVVSENGHQFDIKLNPDGILATKTCQRCGLTETVKPLTNFTLWWWTGTSGSSAISSRPEEGASHSVSIRSKTPSDANELELELLSSDSSIMEVKGNTFTFVGVGTVTLTVRAKINPSVQIQKTFTISHDFTSETLIAPTCTDKGLERKTCSNCGAVEDSEIPTLPHSTIVIPAVAPSCTKTGLTEGASCVNCQQIVTAQQVVPTTEHSWNSGVVTKDATCTRSGEMTYTCTACNKNKTETINATGHTAVKVNGTAATCTDDGLTEGSVCAVCQTVLTTQKPIASLGHDFGAWETVENPSCEGSGGQKRTCTRCGFIETSQVSANGHTWSEDYIIDIWPTCTTNGSCSLHCVKCGAVKESLPMAPMGHFWDDGKVTKDSTCTESGVKLFTCVRCPETKNETVERLPHTDVTIPGQPASCTESGLTDGSFCSTCKETLTAQTPIPPLGHEWDQGIVIVEPSFDNDGVILYTCTHCSDTMNDRLPMLVLLENAVTANSVTVAASTKAQSIRLNAKALGGVLSYASNNSKITVSKNGTVSVPANYAGTARITIKAAASGIYKTATKTVTVTVVPTKTAISSVKNAKGSKMTVSWKKNTVGSGYQVQYSTDKSFKSGVKTVNIKKNSTVSTTVTKLTKNKTYYVRIRTVKDSIYAPWSAIKTVKITK